MATKVRTYRIDINNNAQQGDAIVIGTNGSMTSQHLGTAASLDAGTCCGNVPVIDENGQLPDTTISSGAMKKSVYDPHNKNADAFNYNNLDNTPTIPIVNDPVVTFKQGGVTMGSISLNQVGETEIDLLAGGVTAGNGIDIYNNEVSVDYDNTSIGLNACDKLEVKNYSTIVSGAAAGATAVQANDLATVAMSGKYCDLTGKPEIPSAQIQSDWCQTNTDLADYIKNKPTIGDATITIQKNGTNVDCFTLNQTANKCLNIVLDKCDVGLCNVDNTSDADKPVSNATQCALNCKQDNIADLNTIRCNACDGKTASETIACYGDIVSHDACEFATATQGGKADTAVQPGDLCSVATSGKYCDLTGTPTIPTDNCQLANSCGYTTCTGTLVESDLNPYAKSCDLCSVATSGKYCDLTGTPTIPTDNCELGNGCGYITNAVDDLTNYYLKCETYKKCEVDNLIANFGGFEVVSTLPTTNIKTNVIYLLGPIGTGADKYEEWIYYNNTWTKIGETTTDLSNYAKCCDIPTDNCQLGNSCGYTTCIGTLVASDLNPYAKCCDLKTVATSGCYCDLTGLPTIPTDNCQLGNSCGYTTCIGTLVANDLEPYAKSCDLCTVATSGLYCDLTGIPNLCAIATSGKYCDLTGTPSLCNVATSGKYCDLTGTPSLATVATSGCYNDLTGTPTIPTDNCQLGNSCNYITKDVTNLTCYTPTNSLATVATSGAYCDLTGAPTLACVACTGCYDDLSGKPNLGVYQTTANMVCNLTDADNSHYPTAKAVSDALSSCGAGDMLSSVYDPCGCCGDAFDYTKLHGAPNLCAVATSGKYCDLTGTPTIPVALSAGNAISITSNCINVNYDGTTIKKNDGNCLYADLSGYATTASLCTVATSGCYCDLTGTPTIPTDNCELDNSCGYTTCTGTLVDSDLTPYAKSCTLCAVATSGKYCDLTGTPTIPAQLTSGTGICIDNNKVNAQNLFVINEDAIDVTYTDELGVDPYNANYCYTNVCINPNCGIKWIEGATYIFNLDTKVATSACRNVRLKIGDGDYIPLMGTSAVAAGSSYFVKAAIRPFQYSTKYQACGGLHVVTDSNTTYSTMSASEGYTGTCTSCRTLRADNLKLITECRIRENAILKASAGNQTVCTTASGCTTPLSLKSNAAGSSYIAFNTKDCFVGSIGVNCQKQPVFYNGNSYTLAYTSDIPTDNCQLANSCGYTTCTGTLNGGDLVTVNGCCLVGSGDICIQGGVTSVNTCTGDVIVNDVKVASSAPSSPSEGMVWYDTTNNVLKSYDGSQWNEAGGAGAGDMCYSDFNWATKSGASFTLDLNSTITPTSDFTVNVPSSIKQGQTYVLRVNGGNTSYTMTLGSCITNPWGEDLTSTINGIDQYVFYATSGSTLELQKITDRENCFLTQSTYDQLPSTKYVDGKSYFIIKPIS